jgi:hypothetical protein
MKVLIACECSGMVRRAFAARGHDVWSCDLKPAEDGGQHYQCDVREVLSQNWDFIGAHPECRYLTVSGMHWTKRGLRDPKLTEDAIAFAELLWRAIQKCGRGYLENSVGILSTRSKLGKPSQIIQPYEFGEDASKKTCLWLHGILPLRIDVGMIIWPRTVNGKERWGNQTDSGQNKLPPSAHRSADRARTYAGVAKAMAEQWGVP